MNKLLSALLLSIPMTAFASDYYDADSHHHHSSRYYRDGIYEQRELVKRMNAKLDAEERVIPQSEDDARFYEKLDKIYEDARRELTKED